MSDRMRKRAGPRTNATDRSSTGSGLGIGLRDSPRTYGEIGKACMSPDLPITERSFDTDGDCAGRWLRVHSEMMLGVAKEYSIASVFRSRSPSRLHKRQRAAYSVAVIYTRYGQFRKVRNKKMLSVDSHKACSYPSFHEHRSRPLNHSNAEDVPVLRHLMEGRSRVWMQSPPY